MYHFNRFGKKLDTYRRGRMTRVGYDAPIAEFDRVVVSGYCTSEGRFFCRLSGTVGSVDGFGMGPAYHDRLIKVWSHKPTGDGKLWFLLRTLRVHQHQRDHVIYLRECGGYFYAEQLKPRNIPC